MSRSILSLCALALALFTPAYARAEGALRARSDHGEERGLFPLVRTDVQADIAGEVTTVHVTQRFHNSFNERIEAVYVFPLPDGAAVDAMEMHVGTRVIRATVRRRDEAREAYQRARDGGQHAALLEQERPNVFTFSVANIDPGRDVEVQLRYFETAHYDAGTYEMVFPMVVGPRYIPGTPLPTAPSGTGSHADTDRVTDASRVSPAYAPPGTRTGHAISLAVHLDAASEIQTIEAPAHDVVVTRTSPAIADVALRDKDEIPNRDFILRWRLAAPELRTSLVVHRPDAVTDGYFALTLEPRHDAPAGEITPRELVFLLDTSGSMYGEPLDTAKAAIRRALATMDPRDTFQLIDFADSASSFAPRPLANTPANVARALAYLAALPASGGTNQLAGIHAALSAPGDPSRSRYVVFLTDGYIGNETEVIALTQREVHDARIFALGIGSSVNRYLLDEVALAGRGVAEYLRPREDASALVERLYKRIARPYLTDVQLEYEGLAVQEVYPRALPDLSALEPLAVFGRYSAPGTGTFVLRGRLAGRPFERRIAVDLPALATEHDAIGRVWARQKIASLERENFHAGERAEITETITRVALSHHLLSRYTAMVAVDESAPATPASAPRQIAQPAEAPQGVDTRAAGGAVVSTGESGNGVSAGEEIGDAFGYGGLGVVGVGGGGAGIGTIGHGSGVGQGYGSGAGRGLTGHATSGPRVRGAQPTVSGMLSPDVVRRVVLRNTPRLQRCYEHALATTPTLGALRLVMRIVIGANGQVTLATATQSTGVATLDACVATAVQHWAFPSLASGGTVTVSYPFQFTPPGR